MSFALFGQRGLLALTLGSLTVLPSLAQEAETLAGAELASASRPNIVLILADDLGYSDTAPYGSEVKTPTISALAEQGLSFTNYHTAANCAPSRAMLLTGIGNHLAGVPNIVEMLAPEQRAHAHYQGGTGRQCCYRGDFAGKRRLPHLYGGEMAPWLSQQ